MKLTVAQARQVLKVDADATREKVKAAYKRAALATHPDRNLENVNATLEFQRVGTAYSVLEKYGNKEEPTGNFPSGFGHGAYNGEGFSFSFGGSSGREQHWEEEDEDGEGGQANAEFFEFMFESMFSGMGGGGPRFSFGVPPPAPRRYNQDQARSDIEREDAEEEQEEARRQYDARRAEQRWRSSRDEREREESERRQRELYREQESRDAASRRRTEWEEKQKKLKKDQLETAARIADRLVQVQVRRSAVFASARAGKSEDVRKGIWEDNVVAGDVEILGQVVEEEKVEEAPAPKTSGGLKGMFSSWYSGSTTTTGAEEDKVEDKENVDVTSIMPGTFHSGGQKGGKGHKKKGAVKVVVEEPVEEKENLDINGGGGGGEKGAGGSSKAAKARRRRAAKAAAKKAGMEESIVEEESKVENGVGEGGNEVRGDAKARSKALHASKTLLHIAVETGDTDLAIWLLNHGASPEERDSERYTAFHYALRLGDLSLIEYFISNYDVNNDDISHPLPPHETLLSLAVTSGSPETVSLIVPFSTAEAAQENWDWIEKNLAGKSRRSAEEVEVWEQVKSALTKCEGFVTPAGYRRRKTK